MNTTYSDLSPADQALLHDAPALIIILVGGADGNFSAHERREAVKTIGIRAYEEDEELHGYYQTVYADIEAKINSWQANLPADAEDRGQRIAQELKPLNEVLARLNPHTAYRLYSDYKSLATSVAQTEGGFMRWLTIGPKEAKVIDLPMLDPIEEPIEDDTHDH